MKQGYNYRSVGKSKKLFIRVYQGWNLEEMISGKLHFSKNGGLFKSRAKNFFWSGKKCRKYWLCLKSAIYFFENVLTSNSNAQLAVARFKSWETSYSCFGRRGNAAKKKERLEKYIEQLKG